MKNNIKEEAIREIKEGKKVSEISSKYGINQAVIFGWKKVLKNKPETINKTFVGQPIEVKACSKEIKSLIEQKKLVEAEQLAKKYIEMFPEEAFLYSQLYTILTLNGKKDEVKKIEKQFEDDCTIQSQKLRRLIEEKNLEEAEKIVSKFPTHEPIQYQMLNLYIKNGEVDKAEEISKKLPNSSLIHFKMASMYINQNNIGEARKHIENPAFEENEKIQSLKFKILKKDFGKNRNIGKCYREMESIANRFEDNPVIQSQFIEVLIQIKQYEKAEKICNKFQEDPIIQSQLMTVYTKREEFEKAKEIGLKFENHESIQLQLFNIFVQENDKEKAKQIMEKSKNNEELYRKMNAIYGEQEDMFLETDNGVDVLEVLKEIKENPYDEELRKKIDSLCDEKEKMVCYFALCEKTGRIGMAKKTISEMNGKTNLSNDVLKIIKKRIYNKQKFFDIGEYASMIGLSKSKTGTDR